MAGHSVVLIDTDVFSGLFSSPARAEFRGSPVAAWRHVLAGKRLVISFQTRAEVIAGMRMARWGARRIDAMMLRLDKAPTVRLDDDVIDAYATLTAECRHRGHALHDKLHTADRWVTASAIAQRIPLFSGDGIFRGAPRLELLE